MKKLFLSFFLLPAGFAANAQAIQNAGFEDWDEMQYEDLIDWNTSNIYTVPFAGVSNVTRVSPGVSNDAVRLETIMMGPDPMPGFVANTLGDPFLGEGGIPFSQSPTTLRGQFRYSLVTNDTAFIYIVFKNSGIPISVDTIAITGAVPNFVLNNYALSNFVSAGITPDSVIIFAMSSNFLGTTAAAGSYLEMDNLELTGPGVTQSIPGKFDTWKTDTLMSPDNWNADGDVKKTTDKYAGNYAAKLTSKDDGLGYVENGNLSTNIMVGPGIDTLTGYYKYSTPGNDTGALSIVLLDATSNPVGFLDIPLEAQGNYASFKIPLLSSSAATSAYISFRSSINDGVDGSVLYLDSVQIIKAAVGVKDVTKSVKALAYPNPAYDVLNIQLQGSASESVDVTIYDMKGSVIYTGLGNANKNVVSIPVGSLPAGLYTYKVNTKTAEMSGSFFKR